MTILGLREVTSRICSLYIWTCVLREYPSMSQTLMGVHLRNLDIVFRECHRGFDIKLDTGTLHYFNCVLVVHCLNLLSRSFDIIMIMWYLSYLRNVLGESYINYDLYARLELNVYYINWTGSDPVISWTFDRLCVLTIYNDYRYIIVMTFD